MVSYLPFSHIAAQIVVSLYGIQWLHQCTIYEKVPSIFLYSVSTLHAIRDMLLVGNMIYFPLI